MRRLASILAVALAALGVAEVADGAKGKPPATGDYQADLDINGTYSQGGWTVVKEAGKRRIVASGQYNGIYYPDPGECDNYSLPLKAASVPISKSGKFHVKETNSPGGTSVEIEVDWKGKWKSATRVVGTIKIASGNCSSSNDFTAAKIAGT
jgi:hypothetical protein